MAPLWVHHQPHHMLQYIMESTKKNSTLTTPDESSTTEDFIDDVISIWCPNENPQLDAVEWHEFKQKMNSFPALTWEFSERSKMVDFMDMTITINNSNLIETTLFEKRLNLHLYIPPHSAHPPRLLPGIVYSTLFRIFT